MTTKPLEEDFDDDDDETTNIKVFDDRGSREKVEFA